MLHNTHTQKSCLLPFLTKQNEDGEAAAIWNVNGVHKQIIGPKRKWMYNSTIRFLTRHKAESHQYIRVAHRNGNVQYIYGPSELYMNPALHDSVEVYDGIKLKSNSECIIVYGKKSSHCQEGITESFDKVVSTAVLASDTDTTEATESKISINHPYETITKKREIRGPSFFTFRK